jgi:hypothetical protein
MRGAGNIVNQPEGPDRAILPRGVFIPSRARGGSACRRAYDAPYRRFCRQRVDMVERRNKRDVCLEYTFDRLLVTKLEQVYRTLVPDRVRVVGEPAPVQTGGSKLIGVGDETAAIYARVSSDKQQQFKQTGEATIRARPELKPGTRLMREWQGRTYDVLVLDDGFSWQNTRRPVMAALPSGGVSGL